MKESSGIETGTTNPPRIARTPFYYGWVILAVAALANFTSAPGQTYTFSVFLDSFIDDLEISSTYVSTLYLFGSLTAAGMVIFVGRALDRFGARVMLVVTGALIGLGSMYLSRVDTAWQLYIAFAIMRTLGQGALSLVPATMVSVWFVRKRAMALAIMALGGAAASGVFPIYGSTLIEGFGWRTAWIAIGFTAWGLLIIPAFLFARRSPESIGLLPDGDSHARPDESQLRRSPSRRSDLSWTFNQALRTRALWLLIFAGMAQSLIGTGVMFHQVEIMTDKGLSPAVAAGVFGIVAPSLLAGQFISGYLASRIAERILVAVGQFMILVTILLLLTTGTAWQAYLYGAVLGVSMGFLMNSMQSIWPAYFGRRHLGSIRGVTNFGTMTAAALGPLPLAAAVDLTDSYTAGLVGFMALPPLCAVAALLAGRPHDPPERRPVPA